MTEKIQEILLRKNLPHVATIMNKYGDTEELDFDSPLNLVELAQGVAELNKNGIVLTNIKAGLSREGITKIVVDPTTSGLFLNNEWVTPEPLLTEDDPDLPEVNFVPFKSDSWILGEFIVKYITGKTIPKKFLKSQTLLYTFSDNTYKAVDLTKLLILDPNQRSYVWDVVPKSDGNGCSIM